MIPPVHNSPFTAYKLHSTLNLSWCTVCPWRRLRLMVETCCNIKIVYFSVSWKKICGHVRLIVSTPRASNWILSFQAIFFFFSIYQNRACTLLSPMPATFPAHLIFLDSIARIIFVERYRTFGCSLRNFVQPPVTCYLLAINIFVLKAKNLEFHPHRIRV